MMKMMDDIYYYLIYVIILVLTLFCHETILFVTRYAFHFTDSHSREIFYEYFYVIIESQKKYWQKIYNKKFHYIYIG